MTKLFYNGNIYTMDREKPIVENVLIKNGEILEVNVEKDISEDCEMVNLKNKTMVPGLSDSHLHTLMYGQELNRLDLTDVKSVEEMINKARNYINNREVGSDDWIFGYGWNQDRFHEERIPTSKDLDKISTNYPIVFSRECRHLLVVNSVVLDKIDLKDKTIVNNDKIICNKSNKPKGIFCENAQKIVLDEAPKLKIEDIKNYIIKAGKEFRNKGLTFVQSDDLNDANIPNGKIIQAYKELADNKKLPVRFNLQLRLNTPKEFREFLSEHKFDFYNEFLTLGPLKIWADGSLGARTAALRESYFDSEDNFGELLIEKDHMKEMAEIAYENDIQIACHAIGDRAINQFIEVIEEMNLKYKSKNLRHRIIHVQLADYGLLKRMASAGINVDIQPAFTASDWKTVQKLIGSNREKQSYLWKDMIDLNINTTGSSDCPIETPDPLWGIYCAVTRKDSELEPKYGWLPNQKITLQDAIEMYTINSAYNAFEELKRGKIKVGYQADFTIIEDDLFYIEAESLKDVQVKGVVIDGEIYW